MNEALRHEDLLEQLPWVQNLARRLVRDPNDAEDVAQTAWLTALERPPREVASGRGLRSWLAAVTRTLARDRRRSEERRTLRETAAAQPEGQPSTAEIVERSMLQKRLVEEIHALPEPTRSTVLYRYLDSLSAPEIAEKMAVSPAAVRKRLSRGLAILRSRLDLENEQSRREWALVVLGPKLFSELAPAGATTAVATSSTTTGVVMFGTKMKIAAGITALTGIVVASSIDGGKLVAPRDEPAREESRLALAPAPPEEEPAIGEEPTELHSAPAPRGPRREAEGGARVANLVSPRRSLEERRHEEEELKFSADRALVLEELDVQLQVARAVFDHYETAASCVRDMGPEGVAEVTSCTACHASEGLERFQGPPDRFETLLHKNGQASSQGNLRNYQKHGVWTDWFDDGKRKAEGEYFGDVEHGPWTYWYENGKTRAAGSFHYGQKEGPWTTFHENGEVKTSGEYRKGELHGLLRKHFQDGQLMREVSYFVGKEDGLSKAFHPNGQPRHRGELRYGKQTGSWKYWNEDGTLDEARSGNYVNGVLEGSQPEVLEEEPEEVLELELPVLRELPVVFDPGQ